MTVPNPGSPPTPHAAPRVYTGVPRSPGMEAMRTAIADFTHRHGVMGPDPVTLALHDAAKALLDEYDSQVAYIEYLQSMQPDPEQVRRLIEQPYSRPGTRSGPVNPGQLGPQSRQATVANVTDIAREEPACLCGLSDTNGTVACPAHPPIRPPGVAKGTLDA